MIRVLKYTLTPVAVVLISQGAMADDKAPKPFDDSNIERTLKDGKVQKFDGDKYMIVRRGQKPKPKPEPKACIKCEEPRLKRNRLSVLGGSGPSGDLNKEGSRVSTEHEPFVGLQYQRLINENLSLGIQVQTNESVAGSVGWDF